MFKPKTIRIEALAEMFPNIIQELESIFNEKTNIYIDCSNILFWQDKLGWHFDFKKLFQLLKSFDSVNEIKFYHGTLVGDRNSEQWIKDIENYGYIVKTKPVKIMRFSIDVSSIPQNSPVLLESFIMKELMLKFDLTTVEFLNQKLAELNRRGILHIEKRKCNFDVEIGRDMLVDFSKDDIKNFILFSGDSDFVDPISQLLKDKKKVHIFATARRISPELSATGAFIFEVKKIREFVCRSKELSPQVKGQLDALIKAKGTPCGAPKP